MSDTAGPPGTSKAGLAGKKVYSLAEAKEHTTEEDCWVVISGKVFDVTKFLDEHPGGYDIILTNTGSSRGKSVCKTSGFIRILRARSVDTDDSCSPRRHRKL